MTNILFAWPSALSGAARVLDLGATFDVYNVSPDEATADAVAIYSDWLAVGKDLAEASVDVRQRS
jgi:hypothetical protein